MSPCLRVMEVITNCMCNYYNINYLLGVTVMTLASGMGGGPTLVCTEGLSPPLSHVATPSTVSMSSSTTLIPSEQQRHER